MPRPFFCLCCREICCRSTSCTLTVSVRCRLLPTPRSTCTSTTSPTLCTHVAHLATKQQMEHLAMNTWLSTADNSSSTCAVDTPATDWIMSPIMTPAVVRIVPTMPACAAGVPLATDATRTCGRASTYDAGTCKPVNFDGTHACELLAESTAETLQQLVIGDLNAKRRTWYAAMSNNLVHNAAHGVHWNGEAYTSRRPGR